jgi:hypothetical protein
MNRFMYFTGCGIATLGFAVTAVAYVISPTILCMCCLVISSTALGITIGCQIGQRDWRVGE